MNWILYPSRTIKYAMEYKKYQSDEKCMMKFIFPIITMRCSPLWVFIQLTLWLDHAGEFRIYRGAVPIFFFCLIFSCG